MPICLDKFVDPNIKPIILFCTSTVTDELNQARPNSGTNNGRKTNLDGKCLVSIMEMDGKLGSCIVGPSCIMRPDGHGLGQGVPFLARDMEGILPELRQGEVDIFFTLHNTARTPTTREPVISRKLASQKDMTRKFRCTSSMVGVPLRRWISSRCRRFSSRSCRIS